MKAYKVFDSDWKCRGFEYKVGDTYTLDGELLLCKNGFHACKKLSNCFSYYPFDPSNKVAEVELLGDVVGVDDDKQATNKIKIVRELSWGEVLVLVNSGHSNSGNSNSGNSNSGHSNSGHWNSGHRNSGHWNSGNSNSGDSNSGHRNSGNSNSGDSNSGHRNSGHWNSGNSNSGHSNSGHWNSGDSNSGNSNSGHRNSGNRNSGHWNSGDSNSGLFNTNTPFVRMFNKDTKYKMSDIDIPGFLYFDLTRWVSHDTATDDEKEKHKVEIETCGGFLKDIGYKEAFKRAWHNASENDHNKVKALPNFDAEIFYEISGIRV